MHNKTIGSLLFPKRVLDWPDARDILGPHVPTEDTVVFNSRPVILYGPIPGLRNVSPWKIYREPRRWDDWSGYGLPSD